jgi:enoyl-CoA hydratase/carnithine racemase
MGMAAPLNLVWLTMKFGMARALEFAVGGQPYGGRELVARGIAVRSAPDERVLDEARAYADLLARNTPAAMAAVKRTIRALTGVDDFRTLVERAQAAGASQPGPVGR